MSQRRKVRGHRLHGAAVGLPVSSPALSSPLHAVESSPTDGSLWGRRRVLLLNSTYEPLTALPMRRAVIMALMCQGRLEFESIELAHLIKMRDYFKQELDDLRCVGAPVRDPQGNIAAARANRKFLMSTANESFAQLFEESLARKEMRLGEVITAEVVRVDYNVVVVNAGLKSEAYVPIEEFKNDRGEVEVKAGDLIQVAIEALENGYGETKLSREKAKRHEAWLQLEKAYERKYRAINKRK